MDEGDIPDILLSQIAEMMEYEAKAPNISHMDFVYDEIDDITLSQVCQAMENEHSVLEGLNFMTLTQTVQSYELEFSDEYFAESMEYSVEKIPKAAVAASNGTVLRDITEKSVFQNCHIAFNFRWTENFSDCQLLSFCLNAEEPHLCDIQCKLADYWRVAYHCLGKT